MLGVYVQVKLIICDEIERISGKITLSSNFQNKVKYSDFSVGNEFNTKMEHLSRNIIAPNERNEPTYWFYERLRGQYDEKKKQLHTKTDKEYFDFQYPKQKKFSKEDVAKIWSNWNQVPYDAVKGASSTYETFMKTIIDRSFVPDEDYYKKTIALLLIYKFLMSRSENKYYANGKATVVAYAMAMLKFQTLGNIDLLKIWKQQSISDNMKIYLNSLCEKIYNLLNDQARMINSSILSYGKTKPAYEFIKGQNFGLNIHLLDDDMIDK